MLDTAIRYVPVAVFVGVLAATFLRGRAVKAEGGVSAWAFTAARGRQRLTGALFAVAGAALFAVTAAVVVSDGLPQGRHFVGAGLALTGGALVIVAQRQMRVAWRVGVRPGDAPQFIRTGLFRFSRNPIFVGMILMGLGAALALGAWWGWFSLAMFAVACKLQVHIEEAHLAAAFGSDYAEYRAFVHRWVGW